jgi:hypothetical protein
VLVVQAQKNRWGIKLNVGIMEMLPTNVGFYLEKAYRRVASRAEFAINGRGHMMAFFPHHFEKIPDGVGAVFA